MARSAPRVAPQHNHAKCALRSACSVGGRPTLYEAKGARVAHHGSQSQWPLNLKVRAANPPRCKCGRVPAGGLARSAPRVRPQHNHAKCALRGACSVDSRPILPEAESARAAHHGSHTRWPLNLKVRAANPPRCWCSRVSTGGLAMSAPRVRPQHNHAKSILRDVLRGRSADTPTSISKGVGRRRV